MVYFSIKNDNLIKLTNFFNKYEVCLFLYEKNYVWLKNKFFLHI